MEQTPGSGARVKKLTWHSIFGDIGVDEPQYRQGNVRRRPFISGAGVQSRGCSLALQRAVTDLGADLPFAQAAQKLREHYGVDLSACTIRRITERHAGELVADEDAEPAWPTQPGVAAVIAEIDGGMVPMAQSDPESADRRRGKRVFWKEAKLSLAHAHGSTERTYGATLNGGVEVAGRQLLSCAPSPPVWAPTPGCMRWATGPCGSPTRWGRALRHAGALYGGFLSRL